MIDFSVADFCSGDADEHSVLIYLSEWHHVLKDKSPVEDIVIFHFLILLYTLFLLARF